MADNTRIARMKQKAWSMLDANAPEEALAAFRECVELEPNNLNHQIELGVALYKLNRLDDSLAVLDKILAVEPNMILALNNKARILLDRGQHKEALALYRQILNKDPKHIRTWIKAAQLMASLEKYDKADGCIQEALAVSPEDPELFRPIYDSLLNTNVTDKADRYFILKDFRSYDEARENIAKAYKNKAKWAKSAIINVSNAGKFTSDRTIQQYVDEVWHLDKVKM